ncbi:MAG: hypothetical protein LH615_07210 [Ferruginibacter sp.]|nr:hypothetical protein [Ferruginibacter sp.]
MKIYLSFSHQFFTMYKKVFILFMLIMCCVSTKKVFADAVPYQFEKQKTTLNFSDSNLHLITRLSIKEIEKLSGRKLNFKEKMAVKLYKSNPIFYNNFTDSTQEKKLERKALWSKWLGIGSLIGIIIPFVSLLSLPAAIIAIVFGATTLNKVKDKSNSRQGITFGIITIGVILLIIAIVVALVSSFGIW